MSRAKNCAKVSIKMNGCLNCLTTLKNFATLNYMNHKNRQNCILTLKIWSINPANFGMVYEPTSLSGQGGFYLCNNTQFI